MCTNFSKLYVEMDAEQYSLVAFKSMLELMVENYYRYCDFMNRTKVNKTCVARMKELGIFKGLRDKEETTIFDFLNQ